MTAWTLAKSSELSFGMAEILEGKRRKSNNAERIQEVLLFWLLSIRSISAAQPCFGSGQVAKPSRF
jgi:hypothetical protein